MEAKPRVGRLAVVDPLPMFRRGMAAALTDAGYDVDCPSDPVAWAACRPTALLAVVLTVDGEADWKVLGQLAAAPRPVPVIALVDSTGPVRAARSGARSVLLRGVDVPVLLRTVESTLDGQSVMPAGLIAQVSLNTGTPETGGISDDGVRWLRDLAAGATVAQLAARAGYSERAMFRLLNAAYKQMGVKTRIEAIMRARELGLL